MAWSVNHDLILTHFDRESNTRKVLVFLSPSILYRAGYAGSATRRRVDRDRDFLGSISSRAGMSGASDFSLMEGNSTANSSSPLTMSTEDLSISGKVNANASATSNIKEENPESSYHQQEHKQT